MYETDIQAKILMLPESAKQEVLDFIEFLLIKYNRFSKKAGKEKNEQRGQKMADILEKISKTKAFSEIADPLAWQKEIRQDRPLPERNYAD